MNMNKIITGLGFVPIVLCNPVSSTYLLYESIKAKNNLNIKYNRENIHIYTLLLTSSIGPFTYFMKSSKPFQAYVVIWWSNYMLSFTR